MIGYVYIMVNTAFPDLIKIGRTTKSSTERAGELYTTGTPGKFIVVYDVLVDDCIEVEKQMHQIIGDKRYSDNREFFKITTKEAIDLLQQITQDRTIESKDVESIDTNSFYEGDLSKYYFYCAFIGEVVGDPIQNKSNIYRLGFYSVNQKDANGELNEFDVTPSMKFDLKKNLIQYYNAFGVFDYTEKSVEFIKFGEMELFVEVNSSLLNKSAKVRLDKILQESIDSYLIEPDSLKLWERELDDQTIKYKGTSGRYDSEASSVFLYASNSIDVFFTSLKKKEADAKLEERVRAIKRSLNGNF